MPGPRKCNDELRERARRLVREARGQEPGLLLNAAVLRIGPRVGSTWTPCGAGASRRMSTPTGPRARRRRTRPRLSSCRPSSVSSSAPTRSCRRPARSSRGSSTRGCPGSGLRGRARRPLRGRADLPGADRTRPLDRPQRPLPPPGAPAVGTARSGTTRCSRGSGWCTETPRSGAALRRPEGRRAARPRGRCRRARGLAPHGRAPDARWSVARGAPRQAVRDHRSRREGVPAAGPRRAGLHPPAPAPNELWVVDFTYAPTWSGMAFTASVSDAFSRRSWAGGPPAACPPRAAGRPGQDAVDPGEGRALRRPRATTRSCSSSGCGSPGPRGRCGR